MCFLRYMYTFAGFSDFCTYIMYVKNPKQNTSLNSLREIGMLQEKTPTTAGKCFNKRAPRACPICEY